MAGGFFSSWFVTASCDKAILESIFNQALAGGRESLSDDEYHNLKKHVDDVYQILMKKIVDCESDEVKVTLLDNVLSNDCLLSIFTGSQATIRERQRYSGVVNKLDVLKMLKGYYQLKPLPPLADTGGDFEAGQGSQAIQDPWQVVLSLGNVGLSAEQPFSEFFKPSLRISVLKGYVYVGAQSEGNRFITNEML